MTTIAALVSLFDDAITAGIAANSGCTSSQAVARLGGTKGRLVLAPTVREWTEYLRSVKTLFVLGENEQLVVDGWLRRFALEEPGVAGSSLGRKFATAKEWEKWVASSDDAEWEIADDYERLVCPACHTICDAEGSIITIGDVEEADQEGYELGEVPMECCPLCGTRMDLQVSKDDLQEALMRATATSKRNPYQTAEENVAFHKAQHGPTYPGEFDGCSWDDEDTRNPGAEGCWAEYLEPVGMEFLTHPVWRDLHGATAHFIREADTLGLKKAKKWDYVRSALRPYVVAAWEGSVDEYLKGGLNVVALGLMARRLISATRFTEDELMSLAAGVPWLSHVDGTPLGVSFARFLTEFEDELDDLFEDTGYYEHEVTTPAEELAVADAWSAAFQRRYEQKWRSQFGTKVIDPETKRVDYAATWTGEADIVFNKAYVAAVLDENANPWAEAMKARLQFEGRWTVTGVAPKGVQIGGVSFNWEQAASLKLPVKPRQKDGILAQLRNVYKAASEAVRPQIALVGQAVKAM
jgi:hypothetical protein